MGQAKIRGTAAEREAQAISEGRVKTQSRKRFHDTQPFKVEGHEPTLLQKLQDKFAENVFSEGTDHDTQL